MFSYVLVFSLDCFHKHVNLFSCSLPGALQNHARKYNLPIDELNFCFNMVPVYRDEAVVAEQRRGLAVGAEMEMDEEVSQTRSDHIRPHQTRSH